MWKCTSQGCDFFPGSTHTLPWASFTIMDGNWTDDDLNLFISSLQGLLFRCVYRPEWVWMVTNWCSCRSQWTMSELWWFIEWQIIICKSLEFFKISWTFHTYLFLSDTMNTVESEEQFKMMLFLCVPLIVPPPHLPQGSLQPLTDGVSSPPFPLPCFISLAFSLFHLDACGDVHSGHSYFPSLGYDIEN